MTHLLDVRRMFNKPRRFPRSWKLNENSLQISMHLICSTEVPFTLEHNLRAHSAFIPSWHKFGGKSNRRHWDVPFATIHEQSFPIYYHCGIVDFELWLLGFPSSVPPQPSLCCVDRCDFYHGCPFNNFRTPSTIFWHDALSLRDHHTLLLIGCGFPRGKYVRQ